MSVGVDDDALPLARAPEQDSDGAAPAPTRRKLLSVLSITAGGLIGSAVAVPTIGFLLTPAGKQAPNPWRPVGRLDDFPTGATIKVRYRGATGLRWTDFVADSAAWIRRQSDKELIAFSAYCTHTGCPIRWHEGSDMFLCPCHGGAFHRDGQVAAGPPPKPLPRLQVRVRDDRVEMLPLPLVATATRSRSIEDRE